MVAAVQFTQDLDKNIRIVEEDGTPTDFFMQFLQGRRVSLNGKATVDTTNAGDNVIARFAAGSQGTVIEGGVNAPTYDDNGTLKINQPGQTGGLVIQGAGGYPAVGFFPTPFAVIADDGAAAAYWGNASISPAFGLFLLMGSDGTASFGIGNGSGGARPLLTGFPSGGGAFGDWELPDPGIGRVGIGGRAAVQSDDKANSIGIGVPSGTTDYDILLPATQGTGALTNDGAGNCSWDPSGGGGGASNVVAKAMVKFSTSGAMTLVGAENIASVVRNGTGDYTATFTIPIASNCVMLGNGRFGDNASTEGIILSVNRNTGKGITTTEVDFYVAAAVIAGGTYDPYDGSRDNSWIYFEIIDPTISGSGGGSGTVTSVTGTGTVSGITLSGTVTGAGNVVLGGALSISPSDFGSQTANYALLAPDGTSGSATFRAILPSDIPTLNQNTSGNAATATALQTARTIAMTGDVSWTSSAFDGSSNVTAVGTIQSSSVTLTKMANLAANSIIGNNTGSPATPIALTATQATAMLNSFTSSLAGLAPSSGGGTSNYLRADGTWATPPNSGGTVTNVSALTIGTTGTDLGSSVANGTTTPVITLNVPTASASNRGALSSADWSTFNGKQAALVSATNIKTVNSTTLLGSGNLSVGTVTSVGGTGTVNGLSLSGTVTGSGNITFSGTLDLSSPPVIGATSAAAITATALTATDRLYFSQPTPQARNATTTLLIADILTGIVTATSTTAVTLTLPTGTLTDSGVLSGTLANNFAFDWVLINLGSSSGAVTLGAGSSHTIVGSATIAIGTSAHFRTRKTATNTYVTYRIG